MHREFGGDLRHMTPANAREFLDRVSTEVEEIGHFGGRFFLNEPEGTYEGIVRDFLRQALEMPSDQAVIRLWLHCLEFVASSVTEIEAERFRRLFAGLAADGE